MKLRMSYEPVTLRRSQGGRRPGRIRRAVRSLTQGLARRLGGGDIPTERVRDVFARRARRV
jgi:hypothetical protein